MDVKKLLKLLNDHRVNFVVIGGVACAAHGYERFTKDIDIFVEPSKRNLTKAFSALKELGYDLTDTSIEEALKKKLLFRQYILETDIHPTVAGVDFDSVWKNKVSIRFQGEEVYFASIEDLLKMKKAAGRPQDLQDIRFLKEIKKQKSQKKK